VFALALLCGGCHRLMPIIGPEAADAGRAYVFVTWRPSP
jgi:hypothetical protein